MGNPFEYTASNLLLCDENSNTCFNDNENDDLGFNQNTKNECQNPNFDTIRSEGIANLLPVLSEECLIEMFVKEKEHLPKDDYLERIRNGELELSVRNEALDWICKAADHLGFGTSCICLSINYFDRFLSIYELPSGKAWTVQLLAVACLSLAAKVDETNVPQSVDLQVGEPKFEFEAKTIQRMELLVLSTLRWRMSAFTPCSFIDYFLSKMSNDQLPLKLWISGSFKLILSTIRGIDFLSFRPSEIAAAIVIYVSGDMQAVNIDKAMSCYIHVEKGRVLKCLDLVKDLPVISGSAADAANASSAPLFLPQSPIGVLDSSPCLSYRSNDLSIGSCANSSHSSPDNKRRKIDRRQSQVDSSHEM